MKDKGYLFVFFPIFYFKIKFALLTISDSVDGKKGRAEEWERLEIP